MNPKKEDPPRKRLYTLYSIPLDTGPAPTRRSGQVLKGIAMGVVVLIAFAVVVIPATSALPWILGGGVLLFAILWLLGSAG